MVEKNDLPFVVEGISRDEDKPLLEKTNDSVVFSEAQISQEIDVLKNVAREKVQVINERLDSLRRDLAIKLPKSDKYSEKLTQIENRILDYLSTAQKMVSVHEGRALFGGGEEDINEICANIERRIAAVAKVLNDSSRSETKTALLLDAFTRGGYLTRPDNFMIKSNWELTYLRGSWEKLAKASLEQKK